MRLLPVVKGTGVPAKIALARAPLRLGLAGGGTDVSPYCDQFGGAVLNATIACYAHATIEAAADGLVRFISVDQHMSVDCEAKPVLEPDGKLDLFKAAYNFVVRELNHGVPLSILVSTTVDVPQGSGLGSSSSLIVAMLSAYAEWLNFRLNDYELAHMAYLVERVEARLHGGRQDQYAAVFGGFNFMEFGGGNRVAVSPLRIRKTVVSELESSLLLVYTGRSRRSAEIVSQQSRNVEEKNQAAIDAMHRLKQEAARMRDYLLKGEFRKLHEVVRSGWEAKKQTAQGITNERIEAIYETALAAGACCAKISGAGGGGFMMFMTEPRRRDQVADSIRVSYDEGAVHIPMFTRQGAQSWRFQ